MAQRFTPRIDVACFMTINRVVTLNFSRNKNSIERVRSVINWPNSYVNLIDHAGNHLVGPRELCENYAVMNSTGVIEKMKTLEGDVNAFLQAAKASEQKLKSVQEVMQAIYKDLQKPVRN